MLPDLLVPWRTFRGHQIGSRTSFRTQHSETRIRCCQDNLTYCSGLLYLDPLVSAAGITHLLVCMLPFLPAGTRPVLVRDFLQSTDS